MLYMYNEQDEQNFKVGFKIHLLPKPCPFYHPFSLRKIVSFDFVSMVNCKFLCVWGILFPFLWLLMRSLYFVKKLHVNVIFSPIILNVIFLFHYLFKIKKKYVASYDFNLTSAWPTIQKQMHALKYRKTTHIAVFLIEFDKFNRMLSSAYKITMNQIIIDFNFSQF